MIVTSNISTGDNSITSCPQTETGRRGDGEEEGGSDSGRMTMTMFLLSRVHLCVSLKGIVGIVRVPFLKNVTSLDSCSPDANSQLTISGDVT